MWPHNDNIVCFHARVSFTGTHNFQTFYFIFLGPSLILPSTLHSLLPVFLLEQHSQLQGFFFLFTLQMAIVLLHSRRTHTRTHTHTHRHDTALFVGDNGSECSSLSLPFSENTSVSCPQKLNSLKICRATLAPIWCFVSSTSQHAINSGRRKGIFGASRSVHPPLCWIDWSIS